VLLGGGGFAAYRLLLGSSSDGATGRKGVTPVASGPTGPAATGPSGAAPTGVTPASAPAAPRSVEVSLRSRPAGADVIQGTAKLGTTPAKLSFPHGAAELTLTLRKAGHEDKVVKLTPDRDRDLELELAQVARKGGRGKAPPGAGKAQVKPSGDKIPDLKNPFDE
jgi:hypothetical protein